MKGILKPKALAKVLDSLTDQQIRFVEYYVVSLHKSNAARKAGYSDANPGVSASRVLKMPNVRLYIKHLQATHAEKMNVSGRRVVEELAKIAFASPADFLEELAESEGALTLKSLKAMRYPEVIKKIKIRAVKDTKGNQIGDMIEIDLHDKVKTLELLGKHTAIFTENINLTNNGKDLPSNAPITKVIINHRHRNDELW